MSHPLARIPFPCCLYQQSPRSLCPLFYQFSLCNPFPLISDLFFIRSLPFYLSFVKIWCCLHTNSRTEWVVICQVQGSPILKKVSLNEKLESVSLLDSNISHKSGFPDTAFMLHLVYILDLELPYEKETLWRLQFYREEYEIFWRIKTLTKWKADASLHHN